MKNITITPVGNERKTRKGNRQQHDPVAHDTPAPAWDAGQAFVHLNSGVGLPTDAATLQRAAGNRRVTRLVQARLHVGPAGDRYEQEADRIADQVMAQAPAPPHPQRSEEDEEVQTAPLTTPAAQVAQREEEEEELQMAPLAAEITPVLQCEEAEEEALQMKPREDGGFDVNSDVEGQITARRGAGRPLPAGTQSFMESRFGADFGSVRVHTGAQAGEISRHLQAKAFTHGEDIYFGAGQYDPASDGGKRLLAHELTHTLQQGSAQIQRWGKKKKTETAPTTGTTTTTTTTKTPFETAKEYFESLKKSRFKGGVKKSKRQALATAYYQDQIDKADNAVTVERDVRMAYTHVFGEDLPAPNPLEVEKAQKSQGSISATTPDYVNSAVQDQQPDKFKVTLAVSQERAEWLKDIKALRTEALKSPYKTYKATKSGEVEEMLSKKVLEKRGELKNKTEKEQEQLIEQFSGGIHDVGHTWVRLSTYAGTQLHSLYSFGFWPQKLYNPNTGSVEGGYGGMTAPGPGQVRHPDTVHEGDSMRRYYDIDVDQKQFAKALAKAEARYKSPPPYVLAHYNCTTFAREIMLEAGGSFPGSGLLPKKIFTPGALYAALQKTTGAYEGDKDPLTATVEQVAKETSERTGRNRARMFVLVKLGMNETQAQDLTFEDLMSLFALMLYRNRGNDLDDLNKVNSAFRVANSTLRQAVKEDVAISMSFLGQLSNKGKTKLAEFLSINETALENLRKKVGVDQTAEETKATIGKQLDLSTEMLRLMTVHDVLALDTLKGFKKAGSITAEQVSEAFTQAKREWSILFDLTTVGREALLALLNIKSKVLDQVIEDLVASTTKTTSTGEDPSNFPKEGKHHVDMKAGRTLQVAAKPENEPAEALTFKTDTRVVVVVLNDLTTQYGRCRLQYNGRNLYPRLRDVFGAPKTETSGPQLTKHDTWVMGQLSTFADMGNIVDATMFDTVGGLSKSQLTSMSEEGRKALAEFINITMEELNQIIEEMV